MASLTAMNPSSDRPVFAAKENVLVGGVTKRRFSSPAMSKLASRKSVGARDPSPAPANSLKGNSRPSSPSLSRGGSRSSSPVPSKCTVPGLVAAKEDNRISAREPGIIVPSRYRQPSPVGGRKGAASSATTRMCSRSPGRRISGGFKVTPPAGEGSKKRMGVVIAGISRVADVLAGSSRTLRKSWEDPLTNSVAASEQKKEGGLKKRVDQHAILRTQVAMSRRLSTADSEETNDEDSMTNEKQSPSSSTGSSNSSYKPKCAAPRIVVHNRKWTDGSIPFDTISDNLARLGKEALQRRNIASAAAAEALEEALTTEYVIGSLSMFSDLSSSSKSGNHLTTIERFLSIYDDVLKWNTIAESLAFSRNNGPSNNLSVKQSKSVRQWVEAALATDLGVLSLLDETTGCLSKQKDSEKPVVSYFDPLRSSLSKRITGGATSIAKSHAKGNTSFVASSGTRGQGVVETVDFARALRHEMQSWFLKFVEEALDVGFRLFGDHSDDGKRMSYRDKGKVAAVLSHLKRVNEWLDGIGRKAGEEVLMEKIERLKRKIYGFVITHVGSAFDTQSPF